ncbi:hypothetical protein IWQ62_003110, partial [Dispira parvispora]
RRSQRQLFPTSPPVRNVEVCSQPSTALIDKTSNPPSSGPRVLSPGVSTVAKVSLPRLGVTANSHVDQQSRRNLSNTWVQESDPESHPGEGKADARGKSATVKETPDEQTEKPKVETPSSPPSVVQSVESSVPPEVSRRSSHSQLTLVMPSTWRAKSEPVPTTVPLATQSVNAKPPSSVAFPHRQISPRCPPRSLLAANHRHSCPPITSSVRLTTIRPQVENRTNRSLHQLVHLNKAASHAGSGHHGATSPSSSWINTSPTPSGKLCDVCALGLDPDRVVVNEDGSGWFYQIPE